MLNQKLGFIGAGQMATALARGVTTAGVALAEQLVAHDPVAATGRAFQAEVAGARLLATNRDVAQAADVIVIAVKPPSVAEVAREIGPVLGDKLVISVAAGISLATLQAALGSPRVVRVMPNTPCLVGFGAAAYALGSGVHEGDAQLVSTILNSVGTSVAVPEGQLDAVTGLSGSGPAYVAVFIEALSDGGVRMGLPRAVATQLAIQTVRGTAELLHRTGRQPAEVKDQVASPAGTTIAGLSALEERAFRGAVMAAVEAATRRSAELGRPNTPS